VRWNLLLLEAAPILNGGSFSTVSYSSVLDLSVSAKQQELYNKQKLDIERWTELGEMECPDRKVSGSAG